MTVRTKEEGIAIVGIGALFPGAHGVPDFWRNILSARELIRDVPAGYWLAEDFYDPDPRVPDKVYVKRGAFLDPVDFDPMKYGVPPKLLPSTDTCQLLSLMVADQVLRDSFGGRFDHVSRDRVGCVLGVCSGLELVGEMAGRLQRPAFVKTLREHGLPEDEVQSISNDIVSMGPVWNESTFPGLLNNVVTGRISNHFDLGGPNFTTDAACASSFAAVAMAAHMLRAGDADLVLTGGADTTNDPFTFMCFSKTPALSLSSTCRPFSESSDGTMLGEGIGMLALKRLADAERDGNRIYGVIRGCGSSSDGRAKSIYAPRWEGQVKALRRCYEEAGYGPDTVSLVEAHGTGTKAGDQAEFAALREVFNESGREDRQWAALGSIKSQLGHTKAAAGAAGLIKAVLSLHEKVLPPTCGIDKPGAKLEIEKTAFYLNTSARPWISPTGTPRRAAVSSFGFGGTNFHLTLEEYDGKRERALRVRAMPAELVMLSGDDRAAVLKSASELAATPLRAGTLVHVARETQQRFNAAAGARLAVIASDGDELKTRLELAVKSIEPLKGSTFTSPGALFYSEQAAAGGVGFVFSGQGSQYVGMGSDIATAFDAARGVWDDEAAAKVGDVPLHEVVFPRPVFTDDEREADEKRLRATEWAQPAIGAVSASLLALLQAIGLKPDAVAGHSFGEVSALHAAGVIDRASFLRVARERGMAMARAAQAGSTGAAGSGGTMTAVSAPIDKVESILASASTDVVVADHNDPKQVVISGSTAGIEEAEKRFGAAGIKVSRLSVAAAFHSPIVAASVKPFAAELAKITFAEPSVTVFSNATAEPYPTAPDAARELLAGSIAQRVRFVDVIEAMYARGVRTFVEVGPGSILSSMIGRILADRPHRAVALDRTGKHGVTSLWLSVAQLAVAGHALDLGALWREFDLGPDPRAEPKPKMTVRISGTNYAKKYPPEGGAAALPRPNPPRAPVAKRSNGEIMEPKSSAGAEHVEANGNSNGRAPAMPRAPGAPGASAHNGHENGHANGHGNGTAKPAQYAPVPSSGTSLVTRSHPATWRAGDASAWLSAYEAIQSRTAEAHAVYQQTMAQCHLAFLRAAEQSALALASLAVGAPSLSFAGAARSPALPAADDHDAYGNGLAPIQWSAPPQAAHAGVHASAPAMARPAPRPAPPPPVPVADISFDRAPAPPVRAPAPVPPPPAPVAAAPAPAPEAPKAAPTNPMAAMAAFAPPKSTTPFPADGDLKTFLFTVIAEKTGYPVEILNLDQQLEADLGIDSIKRVEILSAFEGQIPDIKDVNLEEVASLSTLRDVVGFMEKFSDTMGLAKIVARQSSDALSTAPVARTSIDPSPAVPEGLTRYASCLEATAADGFAMSGLLSGGRVEIVGDARGVGLQIVARLTALGVSAHLVSEVSAEATGVVFARGLDAADGADGAANAVAIQRAALGAARTLAKRTAGRLFVTLQDTGGDFGFSGRAGARAWIGGLAGLVKTAAAEWPDASVKAIDVDATALAVEAVADRVVTELLLGGRDVEVALDATGGRAVVHHRPVAYRVTPESAVSLRPGSVLIVSGGARGVTATSLVALCKDRPRLALLGRTALVEESDDMRAAKTDPELRRALLARGAASGKPVSPKEVAGQAKLILDCREIRENIAALERAGAEVTYLPIDVRSAAAVRACVDSIRNAWGPIHGIIHGAGVLADALIANQTDEQFDRVFGTKVDGLRHLLDATASDPLELLLFFASVAGRFGNSAQAAYAMANQVLATVAANERVRRPSCRVRALAWGPWAGGMVTPGLAKLFEKAGVKLIALDAGAKALALEAISDDGQPEVVLMNGEPPVVALPINGGRTFDGEDRFDVWVSAATLPFLDGHRINGVAVVPAVLVMEWFFRAAHVCCPKLQPLACLDLRVFRGVPVDGFDDRGVRLVVHAKVLESSASHAKLELRLLDGHDKPRYGAVVEMGSAAPALPASLPSAPADGVPSPWTVAQIYSEALFHRSAFAVIRSLDLVSEVGASGVLGGLRDAGWTEGGTDARWLSDPALLDGGLQIVSLWARHVLGGQALPTSIGGLYLYRGGPVACPVRCFLRGRASGPRRVVADLYWVAEDGAPVAYLHDVEMHLPLVADFKTAHNGAA